MLFKNEIEDDLAAKLFFALHKRKSDEKSLSEENYKLRVKNKETAQSACRMIDLGALQDDNLGLLNPFLAAAILLKM